MTHSRDAGLDPRRWQQLSALFDQAVDLPPGPREALLAATRAKDPDLGARLAHMLAVDAAAAPLDGGLGEWREAGGLGTGPRVGPGQGGAADSEVDAELGNWRLEGVLGRGGMGTVYAARRDHGDTGQRAALKRLHRRWDGSLQAQRFLQERRILAALSHPHIPRLVDHGLDVDQRPWFALELVEGLPLTEWADAHRLDLRQRVALFQRVCAAVQHAHEHFVVHRDLKPGNILVDADGHPKVLDFGVAKRLDDAQGTTRTGAFVGFTPEYAAPEQVSGGPITAATDVYALGTILYELLAGGRPYAFDSDDLQATATAITGRAADRLDRAITRGAPGEVDARLGQRATDARRYRRFVRGDLSRIVETALAKEPARRYASVQAFAADLGRFLDGRTVSVSGDTFTYRARTFVRRNRGSMTMAAVAMLAAMAGLAGILLQTREANFQAQRAVAQAARAENVRDFALQLLSDTNPANAGFGGDARQVLKHTATQLQARFAGQPELLAQTTDVLASALSDSGDKAEAEALERDVLRALEQDRAAPDWSRALLRVRLSQETLAKGAAAETGELVQRVIDGLPARDARNVRILSDAWQMRAYLRLSEGKEAEALAAARTAAALAHQWLGEGTRETVAADNSVLVLLATTGAGDATGAPAEGQRILATTRTLYGEPHPVTARATKFVAMLRQSHGEYAAAEALYLRLLPDRAAGQAATLSEAMIHQELGSLYEDTDRFADSQREYGTALETQLALGDEGAHSVTAARNNLAVAYYRAGDCEAAERYFRMAGDAWQRLHASEDHAYVLSARTRQADCLVRLGRLDAAAALLAGLLPRLQAHDADFYPIGLGVRASLALARGQAAAAVTDSAAALVAAGNGELTPRSLAGLELVRARALDATGDTAGAVHAADRAAVALGPGNAWTNPEQARLLTVRLGFAGAPPGLVRDACAAAQPGLDAAPAADQPFQAALRQAARRCVNARA